MRLLLTLACLIALAAPALAADKYEMADLEVLDKQGAWQELYEHLGDVLPSKRDDKWLGIAERTCVGQLAAIKVDDKTASQALATAEQLVARYPVLKQSKAFMLKRAEVGLDAFGYTARSYRGAGEQREWVAKIKEFVQADTLTPDLAQRAARKIQEQYIAIIAWPIWKLALDRGANLCKDADFQKSLLEALSEGSWKDEVIPVAQGKCWAEIKAKVTGEVEKTKSEAVLDQLCPVLKAKGLKSKQCEER